MEYTIESSKAIAKVKTEASEITSFKLKDSDYEYMWNGDPKYWKGRNPSLFPQVSSTPSKTNVIYGKSYPMGNHGFLRNSEFELLEKTDNSVSLFLKENDETLSQYPFKFNVIIKYTLIDTRLNIEYTFKNTGNEVMPFGFGLHPAFNTNLGQKDTYVTFDVSEDLEEIKDNKLIISDELFDKYPTVKFNPSKSNVCILHTNGKELKVKYDDFKILAIWSPKAPFVCIEPWIVDGPKDERPFEDRDGYIKLEANKEYRISYSIEI